METAIFRHLNGGATRACHVFLFLLLSVLCCNYQQTYAQQTEQSYRSAFGPNALVGYLAYTPADYTAHPDSSYPLLIFLHGQGEKVWNPSNTSQLYKVKANGPPKLLDQGQQLPFIVISPQCPFSGWDDVTIDNYQSSVVRPGEFVDEIIEKMKTIYRVDPNRIYITGLSMGGAGAWTYTLRYPQKIAASIPIAGWGDGSSPCGIASNNVAVWAFQGQNDGGAGIQGLVNSINACSPAPTPLAKATIYAGVGHDAWTQTYDNTGPGIAPDNIYSWLLRQHKGGAINQNPVSNAGPDKVLTLPASTTTLSGTGTDSDGSITSYAWTKISGPAATLTNASTATLGLSGLTAGTYVFRLTVTDNAGATGIDNVTVTVNSGNVPPVANAGVDKTITLPASTTTLSGSGTDSDGSITSYAWTKISGPAATLTNASTATLGLSGLTAGTYVFRLTVTDNAGATGIDNVTVTVNSGNVPPLANAGVDKTITLPTSTATLSGTGTDSDGSIASYSWTKISGPAATLTNASTATLGLSGLTAGTYVFRLTVTDNAGAAATDDATVVVNPAGGSGNGLAVSFFPTINLTGTAVTGISSTVNFDWTTGAPNASIPADNFSARWTGQVLPLYTQTYTFYTTSDDGIRLWVNGTQVINNWTDHGPIENSGTIALTAGVKYDIVLEYYEKTGGAVAKLSWSSTSQAKQIIPQSQLFSTSAPVSGTGLKGEYFPSINLTGTPTVRTDATINYDWLLNPPFTGFRADSFSVRWTGKVKADFTETYTFYTTSDDGVRLTVNGVQLINNWTPHGAFENSATIALTAGQQYDILLEYFERTSLATIKLSWSSASVAKQIIPQSNLYVPVSARTASTEVPEETAVTTGLQSIYPVPADDVLHVLYAAETDNAVKISLTDLSGKTIQQQTFAVAERNNILSVDVSKLQNGLYILIVEGNGHTQSKRILINR